MSTDTDSPIHSDLSSLVQALQELKANNSIHLAMLYGSFARGTEHCRSDIDIAIALSPQHAENDLDIIDRILMSAERHISILRLDDEDESPLIVQESLKGKHLVEPDWNVYYRIADWALHESESIRSRRRKYAAD
jgi:predicted nucleotidyltransferase